MLMNQSRTRGPSGDAMELMQQQLDGLRRETSESLNSTNRLLSQQTTDINFQLNQRLGAIERNLNETTGQVGQRLDSAVRVIRDVSATMGDLSRASQQILDVGKNISSLQDILRAPKLRGIVGELFLGNLLQQVVPQNYQMQYRFKSGEIVDAVVRLGNRIVPVDAKFPLENFQRLIALTDDAERRAQRKKFLADVKKHIDTIAKKYILPDEGTFDFAMMYIPAENVYYEMVIREEGDDESLNAYAIARRVIPVSPGSLYAYLQAIVFGLRGMQVERRAQEILEHLGRLESDMGRFREDFEQLGTHIGHARNKYDDASKRLTRLEDKLALAPEAEHKPDALPKT
jgi:DNA recombination protein RmuC